MAENAGNAVTTRVLFCGLDFPSSFEYTKQYLRPYPFIQVDAIPIDDVPDNIGCYDICIVRNMKLDAKVIARAKRMKLIAQFGVGLDGVDIEAATRFGIKVAKIPGADTGNSLSCAEHAIYLILGLLRNQKGMEKAIKERRLGVPIGETLYGKTVFIVGYGNIGKDLAVRLRPFGVKILATRRRWASKSVELGDSVEMHSVQGAYGENANDDMIDEKGGSDRNYEFASQADIVVICSVMNSETAGMVNAAFLSSMKKKIQENKLHGFVERNAPCIVAIYKEEKRNQGAEGKGKNPFSFHACPSERRLHQGAFLVNVARGGIIDYGAVRASLESGHLGGLGIDVAWFEPFDPADPILQHPKVLITPHIAGVTELSYKTMAKIIGDCALQLHSGRPFNGLEIVN